MELILVFFFMFVLFVQSDPISYAFCDYSMDLGSLSGVYLFLLQFWFVLMRFNSARSRALLGCCKLIEYINQFYTIHPFNVLISYIFRQWFSNWLQNQSIFLHFLPNLFHLSTCLQLVYPSNVINIFPFHLQRRQSRWRRWLSSNHPLSRLGCTPWARRFPVNFPPSI